MEAVNIYYITYENMTNTKMQARVPVLMHTHNMIKKHRRTIQLQLSCLFGKTINVEN